MTGNKLEQEAKFHVDHLDALAGRLKALGAICTQERTFELNLRFDTADGRLAAAYQVLRLRQGPTQPADLQRPVRPAQRGQFAP